MQPEPVRPVKLTFPAREPGARKIMADGVQVGHCLADFHMRWTAYLWLDAGRPGRGFAAEVRGASLRMMRERVVKRLTADGPWWSEQAVTG